MNIINKISECRVLLMALAITLVVIYHYKCWINGLPWYIGVIIKYGYIGVDIFFFLSGFGLTYSYKKNNLKTFYINRLKKILPCYILYGFILILHIYFTSKTSLTFSQIVYKFSCFEYIFEHKGIDWFMNALLILYILFPLIFHITKKLNIYIIITCIPIIYITTLCTDLHWTHLAMVHRIPMFLLGIYCALNVSKSKHYVPITLLYLIYFIGIIIHNQHNMEFLYTTMLTPLLIYIIILLSTNTPLSSFIQKHLYRQTKTIGSNTLQIYYGTNLASLSYDYLPDAGYSTKAIIFIIYLIFGSYLFNWITIKSNNFLQ